MAQKLKQDIHFGNNILRLHKQAHLTQEQVTTHLQLQGIEISRSSYKIGRASCRERVYHDV